ncbi:unnamed protein product [Blepharisma stoltei]|uniref:Uncharacterized protein n=1 Tax=Blepharisma stoltei TaxID=1481888 RepID=A0AAU9IXL5_9CILI|nr:unnamed protein product [Blepharisma stoltei]
MSGFYSRGKKSQNEQKEKEEQQRFEQQMKEQENNKKEIIKETNKIRISKQTQEEKKKQEAMKLEEEKQRKIKENREKYTNFVRGKRHEKSKSSEEIKENENKEKANEEKRENSVVEDIEKYENAEIPEEILPEDSPIKEVEIEKIQKSVDKEISKNEDDLPPVRIKKKLIRPGSKENAIPMKTMEVIVDSEPVRVQTPPFHNLNEINPMINEKPRPIKKRPTFNPKPRPNETKEKNVSPPKSEIKKNIEKVPDISTIQNQEDEIEAALMMLNIKAIKQKALSGIEAIDEEAKLLEESLALVNITPIPPEISQEVSSQIIHPAPIAKLIEEPKREPSVETKITEDQRSAFSAFPIRGNISDGQSMISTIRNEKKWNSRQVSVDREPVKKIGSVYNEIAARSGRYGKDNPPPKYAMRKKREREPISLRKIPKPSKYNLDVVKINPKVDIKQLFHEEDLPEWAK